MKRTTVSILVLASLACVLLLINAFTFVSSVSAQLGNTGVPVRCEVSNLARSTFGDLPCHAADGTLFGNGDQTVPSSHYLLVTDVLVVPGSLSTGYSWVGIAIVDNAGYSLDSVDMTTSTKANVSEHFAAPVLVLKAGDHLKALNHGESTGTVSIVVTGFLTTNVSYLPTIRK